MEIWIVYFTPGLLQAGNNLLYKIACPDSHGLSRFSRRLRQHSFRQPVGGNILPGTQVFRFLCSSFRDAFIYQHQRRLAASQCFQATLFSKGSLPGPDTKSHQAFQPLIDMQERLREAAGKEKRECPAVEKNEELERKFEEMAADACWNITCSK